MNYSSFCMENNFKDLIFDIVILAGQSNAEGYSVSLDSKPKIISEAFEIIDKNKFGMKLKASRKFVNTEYAAFHSGDKPGRYGRWWTRTNTKVISDCDVYTVSYNGSIGQDYIELESICVLPCIIIKK